MLTLNKDQYQRYGRHLILPEVGLKGQTKLLESRILLIGAGGLGSPLGMYLAAAGVGTLGLVDFDEVELSNLQRQVIHGTEDVGRPKLDSAKETINSINPDVEVIKHNVVFSSDNALDIIKDYDIVIDGTDNFPTRYLTNDACVLLDKPNIYGSIFRFEGQSTVFHYEGGPCYRCLFPEPPPPGMVPSCAEGGVIGVLPGIVGLIQAMEAVKIILGKGNTLSGRLLMFDSLEMEFREVKLERNAQCPVCGDNPTLTELIDYQEFCGIQPEGERDYLEGITAAELKMKMDDGEDFLLLDVRELNEYEIARIDGSRLIPLNQVAQRSSEISDYKDRDVVVHCKMGVRSAQAIEILKGQGFRNLKNLEGGIDQWSTQIDANVPLY